jgi:hypothetical protein
MPDPAADRRFAVDFDPAHFASRAAQGEQLSPLETFRQIHLSNHWGSTESRSGPGSAGGQTEPLRTGLPALLADLGVRTLLDLPCGDANWISTIPLPGVDYLGADLVPEVIARNRERFGPSRRFEILDLLSSPLPRADLVLCRDCLVHFSFADVGRAVANLRRSGSIWLLSTTFPQQHENEDIVTGDWRPLNLERAPFNFPVADALLNEQCTEQEGLFADKSLGLWKIHRLQI